MGSDPQSYLEYMDKHCDCAASRAEKGYLAEIHGLRSKLSKEKSEREKELEVIITGMQGAINDAYSQRASIIAFLAAIFRSSIEYNEKEEEGFKRILYMQSPFGQVSWHISDSDLKLFDHVERDYGTKWDGHDNAEKDKRIRQSIEWLKQRHVTFV